MPPNRGHCRPATGGSDHCAAASFSFQVVSRPKQAGAMRLFTPRPYRSSFIGSESYRPQSVRMYLFHGRPSVPISRATGPVRCTNFTVSMYQFHGNNFTQPTATSDKPETRGGFPSSTLRARRFGISSKSFSFEASNPFNRENDLYGISNLRRPPTRMGVPYGSAPHS